MSDEMIKAVRVNPQKIGGALGEVAKYASGRIITSKYMLKNNELSDEERLALQSTMESLSHILILASGEITEKQLIDFLTKKTEKESNND